MELLLLGCYSLQMKADQSLEQKHEMRQKFNGNEYQDASLNCLALLRSWQNSQQFKFSVHSVEHDVSKQINSV